jgi:DNA-binding beta-propeller fold protein YncE
VTDDTNLRVVDDSTTDKVIKYTLTGSLVGSWTITGAGSSPSGITLDPSGDNTLWIVDCGTDRVYQVDNARGLTAGSLWPSTSFTLAAGNINPQGIADPPDGAPSADQAASLGSSGPAGSPPGRRATPLLVALSPLNDQDLTLLATERIRSGPRRRGTQ